jgi:membrane protease YdiL (CAAX protease family)
VKPAPIYPTPLAAVGLTVLGLATALFVVTLLLPVVTPLTSLGIGIAIGFGGVGSLAARRVAPPQEARLGLCGFPWRHLLPLLLLLPVTILSSELDNVIRAWLPAPDQAEIAQRLAERLTGGGALGWVESVIVALGIAPVVEEFFFRGVLLQGLVANSGVLPAIGASALLFGLGHGTLGASPGAFLSAIAGATLYGVVLAWVRLGTGSLLAAMLLHGGINALGLLGLRLAESFPIAGYNAPGAHTPLPIVAGAVVSVALGLWLLAGAALSPRALPPAPALPPEE